ncbi:ABC transporter substrate-binding protein [Tetragenococcus koreensis]|uniref:Ferrichrome ABC transporter substrate-binding protein n=2 Tax=Tetragenococcus koreensis TaxID=290335 RepID=A0AAN4ZSN0_9ENTE|nr:ABC transporter substrate-binding protein [Tetragenococcus koreensis]MDN6590815.1 ABC transporter substrate-binding protein [Lactobacillus sp.]AYW46688.1 ferrichrome ABC transporter substrate-binding protein [Tetragenococcus koreensis]MCF1618241.1 ABC transporter substrate-binding protein [Tetragenococcus koreensis]MCF1623069.1 ABC transporter substrate-binding protein [Tetragenococcus koreensis]MCF1628089.1 ABC transporter substrate-binding protein [Tetragenococcus koreensis]
MNKKFLAGTLACLAFISLSACENSNSSESASTETEPQTHTLTDAQDHEVEVPDNPQRIIGSYLEDYLVALGEKPVAQWTVGEGKIQEYLQDELDGIPTINFDLPYEDVLNFEPDLLLIESDATVEGGKYEEYEKIAPTYVVKNGTDVTWEDTLEDIGQVFDKEDEAQEVEADYQNAVNDVQNELQDEIDGKSAAVIWVTNNSAFMVAENRSSGRLLYDDLGLEVPELTEEVSEDAEADWSQVSLESLSQLDADYLFLVNSDESAAMFDDPLWENIPAVENDQLFEFGPESSWLYNGPIAYTQMLEDVKEALQ